MNKLIFVAVLVFIFLVISTADLRAQEGRIHVGDLKILPGIAVQGVYDDNIFLESGINNTTEDEESDWITHVNPSLVLYYSLGERGSVSLGYQSDLAYYDDNDDNDWETHTGVLAVGYAAPGGLLFGINEVFTDTEDPYSSLNEYNLGLQTDRWINDLKTMVGYNFSDRLKILAYYNFYKQDYDLRQDYTQDYDVNEFGAGFQIRVLPKTWGFIRYHFGERDYFSHPSEFGVTDANDSDFDFHRVNLGLTWDTGTKLSGELNFGFQWKDYDNQVDVNGNRYDDKDIWIADTLVAFEASPTTSLVLVITRAMREAYSDTNEYYEDTGIGLSVWQEILTKFRVTVGGIINENDYDATVTEQREDDNYKVEIDLSYEIREWLSAGISYNYWKRDSNYRTEDFKDNRFMVSLNAVY
ncbi:MAG: outer membrane beta-barrel protein [Thermodesulfobacteriota bacterium]|nr:outer membrane beta-barrel protein [Thermodesulfobacteriota bacterium]